MWKTIAVCATVGAALAFISDRKITAALKESEEALKIKRAFEGSNFGSSDNVYDFAAGASGSYEFKN